MNTHTSLSQIPVNFIDAVLTRDQKYILKLKYHILISAKKKNKPLKEIFEDIANNENLSVYAIKYHYYSTVNDLKNYTDGISLDCNTGD